MGIRNYELRVNHDVLVTFTHRRSDGLAQCLVLAAKALEKKKWTDVATFLNAVDKS